MENILQKLKVLQVNFTVLLLDILNDLSLLLNEMASNLIFIQTKLNFVDNY